MKKVFALLTVGMLLTGAIVEARRGGHRGGHRGGRRHGGHRRHRGFGGFYGGGYGYGYPGFAVGFPIGGGYRRSSGDPYRLYMSTFRRAPSSAQQYCNWLNNNYIPSVARKWCNQYKSGGETGSYRRPSGYFSIGIGGGYPGYGGYYGGRRRWGRRW